MNCPIDNTELLITDRQGIEIDYCPKCRGVWLDRGELDKLIDRAAMAPAPAARDSAAERAPLDRYEQSAPPPPRDARRDYYDDDDDHRRRGGRRRSFLDDIFDFD